MTADALKQDFESALIKHLSFKARLRSFLYGNGNQEGPLRDPDQCNLGQWIAERLHGAYQHLPEMRELDHQHRLIHQQANHLMDQFQAGQPDAARAGFQRVQQMADTMVTQLQTIEAKLRISVA